MVQMDGLTAAQVKEFQQKGYIIISTCKFKR